MLSKVKNYITDNVGILIRIDDVAENMNWDLMEKSELLFKKYEIKPVLGVIPNNKDKELLSYPKRNDFWEQVRKWRDKGWEISMHGFTHVYDKNTKKKDTKYPREFVDSEMFPVKECESIKNKAKF